MSSLSVKSLKWLSLVALVALGRTGAAEPVTTRHHVAGLAADVEIRVDRWGVPHVYAQNTYDAFFAQGFNAARDRLWQIDLWRKRGLGELAAAFGPAYLEHDQAARLFLFRGDLRTEWIAYASDTKRIVESFVSGERLKGSGR